MLINLSNHPSSRWSPGQLSTANDSHGEVIDFPFPMVNPSDTKDDVYAIATSIVNKIIRIYGTNHIAIHIMGEFTLCYALIQQFKAEGITCLASTTERIVTDNPDGTKTSTFKFVQFREY